MSASFNCEENHLPSKSSFTSLATSLVENFAKNRPIHANSLILTIYGDTVRAYGDSIWLGSLIKLVEPLGINQRLVRTSVFRLSEKSVLQSKQQGRRSYYSLTHRAVRQFASASKRIYAAKPLEWDGQWRLVMTSLGDISPEQRETVRKELHWLGFNRITTGVYGHPSIDLDEVKKLVRDMGLDNKVVILKASAMDAKHLPVSNRLLSQCIDLEPSNEKYAELIKDFQGILKAAKQETDLDPALCFLVKTLLINRFRIILLKEAELPDELLAKNAISRRARALVSELYQIIQAPADQYFIDISETEGGAFTQASDDYYSRFSD
ncbi:PaaX family transcriptional regulator [Leucothrix pacifica]|nr:PaaX family transcriptional regulator C-terminal domain-containing protein [Leucothrix pacifica]